MHVGECHIMHVGKWVNAVGDLSVSLCVRGCVTVEWLNACIRPALLVFAPHVDAPMYQACHAVCKHGGAHHATGTGGMRF